MQEIVIQIVARVMRVRPETLDMNSNPDTVASWDSARHMDLMMSLEQEFGVEFSEEQIVDMMSMRRIIETLKELLPRK